MSQTVGTSLDFTPLIVLASQLPTGITDPHAIQKMLAEYGELQEEMITGDLTSQALEAADAGAYYAAKALANELLTPQGAEAVLAAVANIVSLPPDVVLHIALIKYGMRATARETGRPGKDHEAERDAVATYLESIGYSLE